MRKKRIYDTRHPAWTLVVKGRVRSKRAGLHVTWHFEGKPVEHPPLRFSTHEGVARYARDFR